MEPEWCAQAVKTRQRKGGGLRRRVSSGRAWRGYACLREIDESESIIAIDFSDSIEARMSANRVIVVANEKGGSGKSTVAMHIAIALIKSGQRVATIDLDARQKSFTHYIENRRVWARQVARALDIPDHFCFGRVNYPTAQDEAAGCRALTEAVEGLTERVIFRELYPRGLTAIDDVDEITLGTRPTMSHVSARLEIQNLLSTMLLCDARAGAGMIGRNRGAA